MIKVGIQGIAASFHDMASRKYFNGQSLEIVECGTFPILCQSLSEGKLDYGVMAVENTIAGSLLPNYLLLEQHHFQVIGEVYLRIRLNLMALPGQSISDLQVIQSHPIALHQSTDFLLQYPNVRVFEVNDTAESAKEIYEDQLSGYGAIASSMAAETYNLDILAEEIETNKKNYTRFLIIKRKDDDEQSVGDKASVTFRLHHKSGSLVEILQIFSENKINLSKIQSVPVLGAPYEYSFHVDLEWDDLEHYQKAIDEVQQKVLTLTHFGIYNRGEKVK